MRTLSSATVVGIVFACGYAMSPAAIATETAEITINPGSACQLSIPTISTGVRPKATGFRNESTTTSNFVICPIPSSGIHADGAAFQNLLVYIKSIDGVVRNVTCTATVSGDWGSFPIMYSTKTGLSGGFANYILWDNSDFGGTSGSAISGSALASITCNLPVQTLIQQTEGQFFYEIGT